MPRVLSNEEAETLLNGVSPQKRAMIDEKGEATYKELEATLGRQFARAVVVFDLQGTTAGYAVYPRTSNQAYVIRLNVDLLNDDRYFEDMLNNTLPHEICHIVLHQIDRHAQAHGWKWQNLMKILGLEPKRCHQYEVQKKWEVARPYVYKCDCREHHLSKNLHCKILDGRWRKCLQCGSRIEYVRTEE